MNRELEEDGSGFLDFSEVPLLLAAGRVPRRQRSRRARETASTPVRASALSPACAVNPSASSSSRYAREWRKRATGACAVGRISGAVEAQILNAARQAKSAPRWRVVTRPEPNDERRMPFGII